jgi:hypothetical protein
MVPVAPSGGWTTAAAAAAAASSASTAARAVFVPPELAGFLAWLEKRLPTLSGGGGSSCGDGSSGDGSSTSQSPSAATITDCRAALASPALLAPRSRQPVRRSTREFVRWEAKALGDGLPLPASACADAACLVARGML